MSPTTERSNVGRWGLAQGEDYPSSGSTNKAFSTGAVSSLLVDDGLLLLLLAGSLRRGHDLFASEMMLVLGHGIDKNGPRDRPR